MNNVKLIIGIITISIVIILLGNSAAIVSAGHRGVTLTLGAVSTKVLGEGFHFKIPFIQTLNIIDIRLQRGESKAEAASKDLQQISSKIVVNYRLNSESVAKIYQDVGTDYLNTLIAPATQEVIKAVSARYTAEELITKRQLVSNEIKDMLGSKMTPYGIIVENINIVDLSFSEEFTKAIESKQTAEQLSLKAKRDLDRIKIEAEQKIAQAKAEAESLKLQKQEVTAELIKLREIEVQQKAVDKWDGHLPNVTGGSVPFINIPQNK